ncbi:MAG TPA: hypothetical protein V6D33_06930, partial [Cyanophyceae cyanobacterium]
MLAKPAPQIDDAWFYRPSIAMSYRYRRLEITLPYPIAHIPGRLSLVGYCLGVRLGLLLMGLICLSACAATDAKSIKPDKAGGSDKRLVPVVVANVTQK